MQHPTHLLTGWTRRLALLVAILLLTVALAGCMHGDDEEDDHDDPDPTGTPDPDDPDPNDPDPEPAVTAEAAMTIDREVGWVGDDFQFNASASNATGGNITRYVFDFGDGETEEVEAPDDPVVNHSYEMGGIYVVNLTIHATGDNTTANSTASLFVLVQDRHAIEDASAGAELLVLRSEEEWEETYEIRFGVTFFALTLEVSDESEAVEDLTGDVTVTDADGEVLAQEPVSDGTINLSGALNLTNGTTSEVTVNVALEEGMIEFTGTFDIFYGIDPEETEFE